MAVFFLRLLHPLKRKPPLFVSLAVTAICTLSAAFLINAFEQILIRIVHNSNINLLHFSPNGSFFLLHLSIIFLAANFLLVIFLVLRLAALYSDRIWLPFIILAISSVGIHLWIQPSAALVIPLLQAILLLTVLWLGFFPSMLLRKRMLFGSLFLSVLVIYVALDHHSDARKKFLTQNFLKTIITTQADWARFFLEESFPQIEKQNRLIVSFLRAPQLDDSLARSLWEKTSPAKFNWYSSLEILNDRGDILSYFSLNIPRIFRPSVDLPYSEKWAISPATTLFLGKEKEYLVGYKDWLEGGAYLGRIIFSLSLDYDMLPFLYSANPYYELLRVNSLPSLNQLDLGFAIFDLNGKLLFNPQRISTGLQFEILALLSSSPQGMWSTFLDKQKKFSCFYFPSNKRIYAFFTPVKSFINYSVEFLKLFFFYFALLSFLTTLVALLLGKGKIKNPLWSFSSRVYASFVAVALIPMFLFTFFTQSFFNRIFAEQFIEKAEVHANFARSVLEDFIFLQQEEPLAWPSPPEDLVLWISSTISNDVNLYQDGRLISSSRREFFDSGLIPELIDGEIYYQIQFENNPFYTQRRKIGSYSYYTLTVPYAFPESLLLISLPFPFEKQEIARASGELMEFFVFISAFFMAIVLVFARGLGTTIVRPIQKLLAGTREAGLGNLEFAIDYKSRDEMKTLIDGFNAMIKNLKRHQQELAEMSKKVAWAEMARKVAHEIKNPLTPIQLSAEHLMKVYEDKKVDFGQALKESISYIISEVENLRKIAQEFLEISREGILHPEILDLREVIQETIQPYERLLSERIAIREIFEGEDFSLRGDKSRIKIALRNLLINAIEAIRGKGRITLRAAPKGKYLVLEIRDTGSGMERAVLERIFEPYFSTKEVGTGLGLPIAKKIIEDHGGTIQISSEPGKGTAVTIVLPLLAQSSLNS
jgi:signal transduction histidine kinase